MNFEELESHLKPRHLQLAICQPENDESILAAYEASVLGYVDCIFVGKTEVIREKMKALQCDFSPKFVEAKSDDEAAEKSVELVRTGEAKALMKGSISTPVLLKYVLDNVRGIKKSKVLSHILVFEWERRFKFLTDSGMIPHPTLAEKQEIIDNAIFLAARLDCLEPKVAVLSAIETVNFKIPSTVDAAILAKMGDRKQFGKALVDGPLALDNAISLAAAHHKGLYNEVAGKADILICPDIDSGNIFGKILTYFAKVRAGGLVVGAAVPILLLSRSDTKELRLNSIKLALAAGESSIRSNFI